MVFSFSFWEKEKGEKGETKEKEEKRLKTENAQNKKENRKNAEKKGEGKERWKMEFGEWEWKKFFCFNF